MNSRKSHRLVPCYDPGADSDVYLLGYRRRYPSSTVSDSGKENRKLRKSVFVCFEGRGRYDRYPLNYLRFPDVHSNQSGHSNFRCVVLSS